MLYEVGREAQILVGQFRGKKGIIRSGEVKQDTNVYQVELLNKVAGSPVYGNTIEVAECQIIPLGMHQENKKEEVKEVKKEETKEVVTPEINENASVVVKKRPGRPKKEETKQEVAKVKTTLKKAKNGVKKEKENNATDEIDTTITEKEIEIVEKDATADFEASYRFVKSMFSFEELQEVARRITIDVASYIEDLEILKAKYGFKIIEK